MNRYSLGARGEESAARYLANKGYTIIARNVRSSHKETDIIAELDGTVVFAEVKTRRILPGREGYFKAPSYAVDMRKRENLIAAADSYIRERRGELKGKKFRIDVIEVYADPTAETYTVVRINHYENAVRR